VHAEAYAFVSRASANLPQGPVLEIGSLNINGTIRGLFDGRPYLGIDAVPGPGVDRVANGATYQPELMPLVVVCCEVLEHTPEAEAICRNAYRALAPGGTFIVTAAGVGRPPHSAVDGGQLRQGEFYCNVTAEELERWLSDFDESTIEPNPRAGDIYATAKKAAR
jgi:SAM-dependent methyltransferase